MITKKYYKLVRVSHADSDYFRVTNVDTTAGTLTINGTNNLGVNLEYSTDGVNWTTADSNAPFSLMVTPGTNVYMRGTNGPWNNTTINMDVNHKVGGNVYSLLDKETYASRTSAVGQRDFSRLFKGNTHLVDASDMNFGNVTSIMDNCYASMFNGCISLTTPPPIFPATTLGVYCYDSMFYGCTSLTTAPELPATTLANNCYYNMFNGCTSLTASPELKASTLTINCYSYMFQGCTSLKTVKCLATNISATSCTLNWVYGVPATGTFYKSANMSSWPTGNNGIPSGWTVVDVQ